MKSRRADILLTVVKKHSISFEMGSSDSNYIKEGISHPTYCPLGGFLEHRVNHMSHTSAESMLIEKAVLFYYEVNTFDLKWLIRLNRKTII